MPGRYAGLVYGLSLAVYCTSWTFFGGVSTAATAACGTLPYVALQLESVAAMLLLLDPSLRTQLATDGLVLVVAALMGLFAILFGSRRADRAGNNAGLVLTIALEAVVKLAALLAVGALALGLLWSGEAEPSRAAPALFAPDQLGARFLTLTVIAAAAATRGSSLAETITMGSAG